MIGEVMTSSLERRLDWKKYFVWPVVTYGCESWTVKKNKEDRLMHLKWKGCGSS